MKTVIRCILAIALGSVCACVTNQDNGTVVRNETLSVQMKKNTDYRPVSSQFFYQCEQDIYRCAELVSQKDLVQSLSHLNRMNSGGRHYYLLEKENISAMLNAMSSYKYSECYIINSKGIIIYTMNNDELLGKPVRAATMQVQKAFKKGMNGEQSVEDVDTESLAPASYDLYFGRPITASSNDTQGVIVSTVSLLHLTKQLPADTLIVSANGAYVTADTVRSMETALRHFSQNRAKIDQTAPAILESDGFTYMPFFYKTIHWYIIALHDA